MRIIGWFKNLFLAKDTKLGLGEVEKESGPTSGQSTIESIGKLHHRMTRLENIVPDLIYTASEEARLTPQQREAIGKLTPEQRKSLIEAGVGLREIIRFEREEKGRSKQDEDYTYD